jgi:hypothetical protein
MRRRWKNFALPIQVSRCIGLGVNADLDFLPPAILTPKSNVADEGIPTYSPSLKQERERVIGDPAALTRQTQERIPLVDCLPDTARSPIVVGFGHGAIIANGAGRQTHA